MKHEMHHHRIRIFLYTLVCCIIFGSVFLIFTIQGERIQEKNKVYEYHINILPEKNWQKIIKNPFENQIGSLFFEFEEFPNKDIDIQVSIDQGKTFSNIQIDADAFGQDDSMTTRGENNITSDLLFLHKDTKDIIILIKNTQNEIQEFNIKTHIFTTSQNNSSSLNIPNAQARIGEDIKIVSREEWGADESLRYMDHSFWIRYMNQKRTLYNTQKSKYIDAKRKYLKSQFPEEQKSKKIHYYEKGRKLAWPIDISNNVEKIIIHHTAENISNSYFDESDVKAALQSIYYFHAIKRTWGDIGYNYLIGPFGNIYEGRAGGNGAKAAHTLWNNSSSIGIALMGNFSANNPNPVQMNALKRLVSHLAIKNKLHPNKKTLYHRECAFASCDPSELLSSYTVESSIIGHRDAGYTICPGELLHKQLADIRKATTGAILSSRNGNWMIEKQHVEPLFGMGAAQVRDKEIFHVLSTGHWYIDFPIKNTGRKIWKKNEIEFILQNNVWKGVHAFFQSDTPYAEKIKLTKDVLPGEEITIPLHIQSFYKYQNEKPNIQISMTQGINKFAQFPLEFEVHNGTFAYEEAGRLAWPKITSQKTIIRPLIKLKNTGQNTWLGHGDSAVFLANQEAQKVAVLQEAEVYPGQIGNFRFSLQMPEKEGLWSGSFRPYIDDIGYFKGEIIHTSLAVMSKKSVENPWKIRPHDKQIPNIITTGKTTLNISLDLQNQDTQTIHNLDILSTSISGPKSHHFIVPPQAGKFSQTSIHPNDITTFQTQIVTPKEPGKYEIVFHFWKPNGLRAFENNRFPILIQVTPETKIAKKKDIQIPQKSIIKKPRTNIQKNTLSVFNGKISNNPMRVRLGYKKPYIQTRFIDKDVTLYNDIGKIIDSNFYTGTITKKEKDVWDIYNAKKNTHKIITSTFLRIVPKKKENNIGVIESWSRTPLWDTSKTYNDNSFRGALEIRQEGKYIYPINELSINHYLAGLAEESNNAPEEKLKTMAILARSYALYYMQPEYTKFPNKPYHIDDSPERSQKYLGYSYEARSPNMKKAVIATKRKVVTYNGKLIKTPYFSQSNGWTRSAFEVWNWKNTPYLISIDDRHCGKKEQKGHGVGLSGCGAKILAERGWNFEKIIKYYYPGVQIKEIE
jgi:hypothetical protein